VIRLVVERCSFAASRGDQLDSRIVRMTGQPLGMRGRCQAADLTFFVLAAGDGNQRELKLVTDVRLQHFVGSHWHARGLSRCRASEFKEEGKGAPMTKGWVYLLLCSIALSLASATASAEGIEQETGRLDELIDSLASSDYILNEPQRDDRPYVDPSQALHAFRHVAAAMAWGDVHAAARKAAELDYEVVEFTDSQTKRTYYVLREDLEAVQAIRGWGSYILNPNSRVDALVEVPHPLADEHTPEIGGLVFAECEARGFLLAGTHRAKADVPDLVDSIFHQVHTAWIGPMGQVTAWQIHGFASIKHPFPRGAQVVASTGDGEIVPEIAALDSVLEKRGLTSYVFNELPAGARENKRLNGGVPGVTFTSLAAAKNEQGRLSRSLGGSFVHIELEVDLRASRDSRKLAGSAIAAVIAESAKESAEPTEGEAGLALADAETPAAETAAGSPALKEREDHQQIRVAAKPVSDSRRTPASADDPRGQAVP